MIRSILCWYFYLLNYISHRKGVFVLMYHRINDDLPPNHLIMPTKKFREQMRYLKKHCDVIGSEELCAIFTSKNGMARKRKPQVVITIDDGYRDNFTNAYPILKELNLPATIFLVTGLIGTDKKMGSYERMPGPDMLNWEEVKIMAKNNITFGPHTDTHPHLPELNYFDQKREIETSLNDLYTQLTAQVGRQIFSYTYGEYNEDTLKIMRELDIKIAFTVNSGINDHLTDPLELNRTEVDGREELVDLIRELSPSISSELKGRVKMLRESKRVAYVWNSKVKN